MPRKPWLVAPEIRHSEIQSASFSASVLPQAPRRHNRCCRSLRQTGGPDLRADNFTSRLNRFFGQMATATFPPTEQTGTSNRWGRNVPYWFKPNLGSSVPPISSGILDSPKFSVPKTSQNQAKKRNFQIKNDSRYHQLPPYHIIIPATEKPDPFRSSCLLGWVPEERPHQQEEPPVRLQSPGRRFPGREPRGL